VPDNPDTQIQHRATLPADPFADNQPMHPRPDPQEVADESEVTSGSPNEMSLPPIIPLATQNFRVASMIPTLQLARNRMLQNGRYVISNVNRIESVPANGSSNFHPFQSDENRIDGSLAKLGSFGGKAFRVVMLRNSYSWRGGGEPRRVMTGLLFAKVPQGGRAV
jgi:hypothetical protein